MIASADSHPRSRWLFLLAGLAALGVAAARTIFGGRYDLPLLVEGLERPAMAAVIYINWYALNVAFAALGVALLVAATLHRSAARAIATLAGIVFGSTCALFGIPGTPGFRGHHRIPGTRFREHGTRFRGHDSGDTILIRQVPTRE